ncbi:MAG: protease pro-enzyme activation domain-containing protein [Firmicutes bacterium]|nr:protease pro-enzyme activation domain-containing protein [Bacillota bacterium]
MKFRLAKGVLATLILSGAAVFPLAPTSAMAQSTSSAPVPVPQGVGPKVLQQATVFGSTPASTPVTVSLILNTQNASQLASYIQQSTTPGNPAFRKFLTTQQFAQTYGQPQSVIQSLVQYFAGFGITNSYVYADDLDITLNGTAGQFDQAFGTTLQNMQFNGHAFHGAMQPQLPGPLASPILAVLGLTNYTSFATNVAKTPAAVLSKIPATDKTESSSTPPAGWQTPQDLEQHYNVSPLIKKGDLGQGQTLGIVTLASLNPSDAYAYWKAYNIPVSNHNRITLDNVDGGAGAPSLDTGSDETTLDVEQSGALAPDANIVVYQAPNTDYGFADAFATAISDNQVGSLSASWGQSEDSINSEIAAGEESSNYAQVFNELFEEADAQGISTFVATGDSGAYEATADNGTTDLNVGNPSDSPYVTAAGGTTIATNASSPLTTGLGITIPSERAWGWDYLFPLWQEFGQASEAAWAEQLIAGGNGGYSEIFPEPWYQQGISGVSNFQAVQWFTSTQDDTNFAFHASPHIVSGQSNGGRAMPDLSMNADPETGYTIYSTLFDPASSFGGPWAYGYGGTSFVAPQLNGIAALINESAGGRVGFWNPQIYQFAKTSQSPFTPLDATGTSNDNLYYSGTAGTIYNPATGLGTPNVAALSSDFIGSAQ